MSVKKVALSVTLKAKPGKTRPLGFMEALKVWSPMSLKRSPGSRSGSTRGHLESLTASAATRPARRIFRARSLPALLGHAEELLDGSPEIHPVDILAEKLPA
jgi:hypothetical protein